MGFSLILYLGFAFLPTWPRVLVVWPEADMVGRRHHGRGHGHHLELRHVERHRVEGEVTADAAQAHTRTRPSHEELGDDGQPHRAGFTAQLDEKLDRVADDLREIKTRVGILEQQYASMSNRIDRIESRLERIERRLSWQKRERAPILSPSVKGG